VIGVEEAGTLFGDVLDFDGVGFAIGIEVEDWTVWGHCGGFTSHREKRLGMEKQERERGYSCDGPAVGSVSPADGGGQRTRSRVEPTILVFIPQPTTPRSITLPAGRRGERS